MKQLIIAEKPKLASTICGALNNQNFKLVIKNQKARSGYYEGNNYIVSWCYGHMLSLFDVDDYFNRDKTLWSLEELPFIPVDSNYRYKLKDTTKDQVKVITELISSNKISEIIHAGDADSEGQVIVESLLNYCFELLNKNLPVKRLWLNEQTETNIRQQLKNMKDISEYRNYYEQGVTRAAVDFCMGINYTRALTLISNLNSTGKKELIPQGRCLGAIVKYIYDRYIAQKEFIEQTYYNIGLKFTKGGEEFSLIIKDIKYNECERDKAVEKLKELSIEKIIIKDIQKKEISKFPGKLFSLTTLQSFMGKKFKISNMETLTYTQKLYEQGYLTYPRTNTEYLAENEKTKVIEILNAFKARFSLENKVEMKNTKKIFDDSKIEAHSAITPTTKIPDLDKLSKGEKIVYETVMNRFLANFCIEKCILDQTVITISVGENIATLKGTMIKQQGYLIFEKSLENKPIPSFETGELLKGNTYLHEGKTQPPKNVDIDELNKFLENPFKKIESKDIKEFQNDELEENINDDDEDYKNILQGLEIGTTATRAGIIENAKGYKYISEKKGIFQIEEKGIYFIETASKLDLIMNKEKTATLGKYLKAVFNGVYNSKQVIRAIEKEVATKVNNAKTINVESYSMEKEIIGKCPICSKDILESSKAYYCSGFRDEPKCTFALWKNDKFLSNKGKKLTLTIAKALINNKTAAIKGLKKTDGTKYDATITYKKNGDYYNIVFSDNSITNDNDAIGICPRCNKEVLESSKAFYCAGYKNEPKCSFAIWKNNKFFESKGAVLNKGQVKEFLEKKECRFEKLKKTDSTGTYNAIVELIDTGTYVNFKVKGFCNE